MDQKEKDCAYWVAVLLAGLALGAVGGFVFGWLWKEGPTSPEATKLVDVFIALGTIGAVLVALWQSWRLTIRERTNEKLALQGILVIFREVVDSCCHICDRLNNCVKQSKDNPCHLANVANLKRDMQNFLISVDFINKIPFYEHPYSKAYAAIIYTISPMREVSDFINGISKNEDYTEKEAKELLALSKRLFTSFERSTLEHASLQGVMRPTSIWLVPGKARFLEDSPLQNQKCGKK